ncbi:MAG: PQQ-binding-like beta-propeller repeat protein, partial [Dehalococcoidia bacterium]
MATPVWTMTTSATPHGQLLCPTCLSANPVDSPHCTNCWASLLDQDAETQEKTAVRIGRAASYKRWRRRILIGTAGVVVAAIAAYTFDEVVQFPVPQPVSSAGAAVAPGNWSLPGVDVAHTSAVEEAGPLEAAVAWQVEVPTFQLASPAVADGVVYVISGDGRLLALEAGSGGPLWERPLSGPQNTIPAITEQHLYVTLRDGNVLALDRATGDEVWRYQTGTALLVSPLVYEGVLYVSQWTGGLLALDAQTGDRLWDLPLPSRISATPSVSGDIMAIPLDRGDIYFVDIQTGNERMSFDVGHAVHTSPVFLQDRVLVATSHGFVISLDPTHLEYSLEKGTRYWRMQFFIWGLQALPPVPKGFMWANRLVSARNASAHAPAVAGDTAFITTTDGNLHALDVATGEVVWEYTENSSIASPPVAAGPYVYFGTRDGDIHVVDQATGEARSVIPTGLPVDGRLVVT